jgi:K+-sensing histidine kinase KdpD
MWRTIEGFLSRLSRAQVLAVAVGFVLAVGGLDYVSGPHLAFPLLYLLPVALAVWFGGAEQRRAVARERESVKRLEEINAMKDTFLRAVSHDLRNPLAAIVGSASILQQRRDLSTEQAGMLVDAIIRAGKHVPHLIDQLFDVERIKERAFQPEMVTTDVAGLVTGIVREWSAMGERDVVMAEAQPVMLPVDVVLMQRIVENLLDNAAKYGPAGGHIWARVFRAPGSAILAVDDEGPGVPPEMRDAVFDLFERGQQAPSRAGDGARPLPRGSVLRDARGQGLGGVATGGRLVVPRVPP